MIDAWDIFRALYILAWFIGTGLIALFIMHFKPTRRLLQKFFPFLFE